MPALDWPRVAIILVNYGDYAQRHFSECSLSLAGQDYPRDRIGLFITDNASTEQSQSVLRRMAPSARILPQARNTGWAGGCNFALRAAMAEGFGTFVLLNMDMQLAADWLRQLMEAARNQPNVQILQSKILIYGTDRINSVGNRIQFLGYGTCNGYGLTDLPRPEEPMDFASGACMLIKREVLEKIGLFREEYFLYYDDLEFSWRARLAGFQVGLAPRSICRHKYDFKKMRRFIYLLERNRLLTLLSLEKIPTLLLIAPALILFQTGSLLYFSATGQPREMLRLIGFFLRPSCWRNVLRWRKENGVLRKRADREIAGNFAGRIRFAEIRSPFFQTVVNPLLKAYWGVARRLIFW